MERDSEAMLCLSKLPRDALAEIGSFAFLRRESYVLSWSRNEAWAIVLDAAMDVYRDILKENRSAKRWKRRQEALRALVALGGNRAFVDIVKRLKIERLQCVKETCIECIVNIAIIKKNNQAIKVLAESYLVDCKQYDVRAAIVRACAKLAQHGFDEILKREFTHRGVLPLPWLIQKVESRGNTVLSMINESPPTVHTRDNRNTRIRNRERRQQNIHNRNHEPSDSSHDSSSHHLLSRDERRMRRRATGLSWCCPTNQSSPRPLIERRPLSPTEISRRLTERFSDHRPFIPPPSLSPRSDTPSVSFGHVQPLLSLERSHWVNSMNEQAPSNQSPLRTTALLNSMQRRDMLESKTNNYRRPTPETNTNSDQEALEFEDTLLDDLMTIIQKESSSKQSSENACAQDTTSLLSRQQANQQSPQNFVDTKDEPFPYNMLPSEAFSEFGSQEEDHLSSSSIFSDLDIIFRP